jgi:hypothetical protein
MCGTRIEYAQEAPKKDQPASPAFSLVLKATPSPDQNGQQVEVAWTNTSSHEIVWQRAPVDSFFDIDIRDAESKRPPRRTPNKTIEPSKGKIVELPTGGGPLLILTPGETLKFKVDLASIYDLTKKGSYLVRFHRFDGEAKVDVVSNEIAINLK